MKFLGQGHSDREKVNKSETMKCAHCTSQKEFMSTDSNAARRYSKGTALRGSAGTHDSTLTAAMKSAQPMTPMIGSA